MILSRKFGKKLKNIIKKSEKLEITGLYISRDYYKEEKNLFDKKWLVVY